MIKFEFGKADFVEVHRRLCAELNIKLSGKSFIIPEAAGKGFVWAEELPWGISVMVSETSMNEDFTFNCIFNTEYAYCLRFNDSQVDPLSTQPKEKRNRNASVVQTSVQLTDTLHPISFILPAGINLRSVRLFFTKEHMLQLLGKPEIEYLLSQYFEFLIKNKSLAPIDTEYRVILNELLLENINHPLRLNYIQNRAMLLIEKFILKLHNKRDLLLTRLKNNDDEIARLMRVEAMLVKDFSDNPPTILQLSKISAMSPTKLKMDFKSLYGLPIYEYFQKNRMLKAQALLLLAKFSIKQVGNMVGYSNLSHFANTFKREFGVLPSEMDNKGGMLDYNA